MRYILAIVFCFFAASAWAFPLTTTYTVSELDGDMAAFIKILSGSPTITVFGIGPNRSDPTTIGTLTSSSQSLHFKGPYELLTFTETGGTGHAEVSWCGRVAP